MENKMGNFRQYVNSSLNSMLPELEVDSWDFILKVHQELLKGKSIVMV